MSWIDGWISSLGSHLCTIHCCCGRSFSEIGWMVFNFAYIIITTRTHCVPTLCVAEEKERRTRSSTHMRNIIMRLETMQEFPYDKSCHPWRYYYDFEERYFLIFGGKIYKRMGHTISGCPKWNCVMFDVPSTYISSTYYAIIYLDYLPIQSKNESKLFQSKNCWLHIDNGESSELWDFGQWRRFNSDKRLIFNVFTSARSSAFLIMAGRQIDRHYVFPHE